MEELKRCPFCGKFLGIHTHPEWDEKQGLVWGALIEHRDCVEGMEVSLFSVGCKRSKEEAYNALLKAYNTRYTQFTEGKQNERN